jgi:murein DD-endopeptidase MepM/ murein hydrolase activator NlpD
VSAKIYPVVGPITVCGPWGARGAGWHWGIDLCAPLGTPLVAVDDGSVHFGTDPLGGLVAVLTTKDGDKFYYAHMDRYEGSDRPVQAGDVIGYVDNTGNAAKSPSHVHFEFWPGGQQHNPPDPAPLLATTERLGAVAVPAKSNVGRDVAIGLGLVLLAGAGAWALTRPARLVRRARFAIP